MFKSDAFQDQFVHKILNGKRNGYFVDIGSCGAINSNNTYFFESLGWKGICIEIEKGYADSYHSRSCTFINQNALTINYKDLFEHQNSPKWIDYLSVDIDELSIDALKLLPHDIYKFGVITIEHDGYIYGDKYRNQQRDFLNNLGYHLLGSNVRVPDRHFRSLSTLNHLNNNGFEDWWIHPTLNVNNYKFDQIFPEDLISRI